MGKKRVAVFGQEVPSKSRGSSTQSVGKKDKKRKVVKTGKDSGRLTDMGEVALAEAEKIKQKEKEQEEKIKKSAKKSAKKETPTSKKRLRSKRYLQARQKIDRTKTYPITEAIKLVKETSLAKFGGKIELHLNVKEKGLKRKLTLPHPLNPKKPELNLTTEKKFPVVHLILGPLEAKNKVLEDNFMAVLSSIGHHGITKAVVCSTMGPGIKVSLTKPEK